jgi:GTPase
LDNGKGLARFNVFRHKHEIICGKTSSISHQILGFDENGELTNYGKIEKPSWAQIVNKSSKILNFYDMGKKTVNILFINCLDDCIISKLFRLFISFNICR